MRGHNDQIYCQLLSHMHNSLGRMASSHLDIPGTRIGGRHQGLQLLERLLIEVTPHRLWRLGWERGEPCPELRRVDSPALRCRLGVVNLYRRMMLEHVQQSEFGLMLSGLLKGILQGMVCSRRKIRGDKNMGV